MEKAQQHQFLLVALAIVAFICRYVYRSRSTSGSISRLPFATVTGLSPKQAWLQHGEEVLKHGFEVYRGRPFQIMTGTGPKLVLGNKYADEVSKHKGFSLAQSIKPDLFANYPGFEGIRYSFQPENEKSLPDMIRQHMTQALGSVTADLVEEATIAIDEIFGEEGRVSMIKHDILLLVARLSTRVLLGQPLCTDQRWLKIVKSYAIDAFFASHELRMMRPILRPVLYWFSEPCTRLRKLYYDAISLMSEEVARRESEARQLLSNGGTLRKKQDSISWLIESNPRVHLSTSDLVAAQLGLAVASVQTTSEATSQALYHLCEHPQYLEPLRKEVLSVFNKHGWTRTSLYQMKLMDSFLKESQRVTRGRQGLGRIATQDIQLSDGLFIPRGTRVVVEAKFWDLDIYGPNVKEFDAYRFVKKREKLPSAWQYVSTTPAFMGFGLGVHSCPGRFFASNEIKIALSILLLKYDWTLLSKDEDDNAKPMRIENVNILDMDTKLRYERRREESDLAKVGCPEILEYGGNRGSSTITGH